MEKHIKLTINTPENEFYSREILSLSTENNQGRFGILPNHVSMLTQLVPTVTSIIDLEGKKLKIATSTGVLRVYHGEVEILCSACEWQDNKDI